MKALRAYIKGWTASYRIPFLAVVQPSLPVPPLSTVYGVLSAIVGKLVDPGHTAVGFVAPFQNKARDLEWIYQVGEKGRIEKTNVIEREFLYEPELYLYVTNLKMQAHFASPRYPILLGRSCDLAKLVETRVIDLLPVEEAEFQYTLLPYPWSGVAAPIMALPVTFTDTAPRRAVGVRPFHIIESKRVIARTEGDRQVFTDPEKRWGIYFHGLIR